MPIRARVFLSAALTLPLAAAATKAPALTDVQVFPADINLKTRHGQLMAKGRRI